MDSLPAQPTSQPTPVIDPASPPTVPTKPKTPKILIWLISLLLIALLGFVGFKYFQTQKPISKLPATSPVSTQSPQSSASSQASSSAATSPQVSLKLSIESTDSGKIKGSVKVSGSSDQNFTDLYYDLALNTYSSAEIDIPVAPGSKQTTKATIKLAASPVAITEIPAKELTSFVLPYSSHVHADNYQVSASLVTKEGKILQTSFSNVNLNGKGDFLNIDPSSCAVIVNGTFYEPHIAPPVDPNQPVTARCTVTNTSSSPITAKYQNEYAVLEVRNYPLSDKLFQTSTESISFAPKETKKVTFNLPSLSVPQVYSSMLGFIDPQNGLQSVLVPLRWTISGPSARIEEVGLDKNYYSKGENAVVSATVDPSLDLFWRNSDLYNGANKNAGSILQKAVLAVSILDQNNQPCGSSSKDLPAPTDLGSWGQQSLKVSISRDCQSPKAQVTISNDGKELARLEKQVLTPQAQLQSTNQPTLQKQYLIVGIGLLTMVVVVVFLFLRKRNTPLQIILIPLIVSTSLLALFSSQEIRAYNSIDTTHVSNPPGMQIVNIPPNGSGTVSAKKNGSGNSYSYLDATANTSVDATSYTNQVVFGFSMTGSIGGGCNNTWPGGTIAANNTILFSSQLSGWTGSNNYTGSGISYNTYSPYNIVGLPISGSVFVNKSGLSTFQFDFIAQMIYDNGRNSTDPYTVYYNNNTIYPTNYPWPNWNNDGAQIGIMNWSAPSACTDPPSSTKCAGTYYDNYGNSCSGSIQPVCDGSNTCVGQSVGGTCGSTCPGTKQPSCSNGTPVCGGSCDSIKPTVSIVGFPNATCFTPLYWNSTTFTQPLKMLATDDTFVDSSTARFRVHKVSDGSSSSNDVIMTATSVSGSGYNYQSSTSSSNPFNSLASRLDPGSNATAYILTAEAKDSVGLLGNSAGINFTFSNNCTTPYLKTQGGDVHSNTGISVNGGPSPSP